MESTLKKCLVLCLILIAACVLMLSVSAQAEEAAMGNPYSGDARAIAEGSDIFFEYCSECHGDGRGGTGPNIVDEMWKYGGTDEEVFISVSGGRPGGMPAMQLDIKEDEIWKVIAYIRSLKK